MRFLRSRRFLLSGVVVVIMSAFVVFLRPSGPALVVISTTPQTNATHNPFLPIVVQFNRAPKPNEYSITINPKTDFSVEAASDTSIKIIPVAGFLENTEYSAAVVTKKTYTIIFTTDQLASNVPGWNAAFDKALQQDPSKQTQERALFDIRQSPPIVQLGFTISFSYDKNMYTVMLNAPYEQNKKSFVAWASSRGITDLSMVPIRFVSRP